MIKKKKKKLTSRDNGPVVDFLRIFDQSDSVFETLQTLILSTLDQSNFLLLLTILTVGNIPQESVGTTLGTIAILRIIGITTGLILLLAGLLLGLLLGVLVDILLLIGGAGLAVATTTVEESRRHRELLGLHENKGRSFSKLAGGRRVASHTRKLSEGLTKPNWVRSSQHLKYTFTVYIYILRLL